MYFAFDPCGSVSDVFDPGAVATDMLVGGATAGLFYGANYLANRSAVGTTQRVENLKFGDSDLVYGPSAEGRLRNLQETSGGKLLTDLNKPVNMTNIEFSRNMIDSTVNNGNTIRFDLTFVDDINGVLANTGKYANTVTAQELQYIMNNWNNLSNGVRFYSNGMEVAAPWIK